MHGFKRRAATVGASLALVSAVALTAAGTASAAPSALAAHADAVATAGPAHARHHHRPGDRPDPWIAGQLEQARRTSGTGRSLDRGSARPVRVLSHPPRLSAGTTAVPLAPHGAGTLPPTATAPGPRVTGAPGPHA